MRRGRKAWPWEGEAMRVGTDPCFLLCVPPVSAVSLLLFSLSCPVFTGNAEEPQQSLTQPECLLRLRVTGRSRQPPPAPRRPKVDGTRNQALSALPLSSCAVVVRSCVWYQCHIKVAK